MKPMMVRLWRQAQRRLGPSGLTALALLVAGALAAAWIPQLQQRGDQLRASLVVAIRAASAPAPAATRRVPVGEQVGEFIAAFPPLTQSAADLDAVFDSADRHHVQLLKGEYQLKQEPNAPLVAYSATFPLRSEYGAIKEFAADVLRALPNTSMDELRMSRSDTGSKMIDSVVRFTFVYRSQ